MPSEKSLTADEKSLPGSMPEAKINWLSWLTGSTLLASLGYGSSYVTGLVYHQTYLSRFNVPPDIFKGTTAEYFVFAYTALLELLPSWLGAITGGYKPLALIFLLLFVGGSSGFMLAFLSRTAKGKRIHALFQNSKTLHVAGGLFGIPAMAMTTLIFFLYLLIFITILPAWIGSGGAEKTVARDKVKFSSACSSPTDKARCMDLIEDEKVLATGYVLQASDRYIALVTTGGVKILPLKERALQTHVPANSGEH